MDCDKYKDDLLLYAAGALSPEEAEPVRLHLASGCPVCAGRLAEAQATLSLLAMTLPEDAPPAGAAGKLMNRIEREHSMATPMRMASSAPSVAPVMAPWWMQLAIPSAIAASIAAAVTIFFAIRIQDRLALAAAPNANLDRTLSVLTAMVQQQQHELAVLRSTSISPAQTVEWESQPDLKMLSLAGTDQQPAGARGRIFWDADRGVWHFFADGMKPAEAGKTYELWFVSADGKTAEPAGSFNPTPDGTATLISSVPKDIASRLTVGAVTDEPVENPGAKPTGSFQLKGALN